MSKLGFFRSLFSGLGPSNPAAPLFRHLATRSVRRIVELGVGDGQRAAQAIRQVLRYHSPAEVRYTGLDQFEARPHDQPGLTLKQAHRILGPLCHHVRLVPGELDVALRRCANELRGTDLVIISDGQQGQSLAGSWHFLPRMLHNASQVWVEQRDGSFEVLSPAEIRAKTPARRAAA